MRRIFPYRFLLCFALFLRLPAAETGGMEFRRLTMADGLPSHTWMCMAQDARGFLWLGGMAGLFRYDGVDFVPALTRDGHPLPPVYSLCISTEEPGTLYAGAENEGIFRIRGTIAESYCADSSFTESFPRSIIEEHRGVIWTAAGSVLSRIVNGTRRTVVSPFTNGTVSRILRDASGVLYFLSNTGGLLSARWEDSSSRLVILGRWPSIGAATLFGNGVAAWDPSGRIVWIGKNGIEKQWEVKDRAMSVQEMIVEGDSTVWLGNVDGVVRIDRHNGAITGTPFGVQEGMPEHFVLPAMTDREGRVWFRTFSKGLVRTVQPRTVVLECTPAPIVANNASIIASGNGTLLAVATNGLMEIRSVNSRWEQKLLPSILPPQAGFPNALAAGPNGMLAVKYWYGDIVLFDHAGAKRPFTVIRSSAFAPGAYRTMMMFDRTGRLWCAAEKFGVAVFSVQPGIGASTVAALTDPPFRSVTAMQEMRNGAVWIADKQGRLSIVTLGTEGTTSVTEVRAFHASSSVQLRALAQDESGRVWAGTKNHGLFLFEESGAALADSIYFPSLLQLHALTPDGNDGMLAATMEGIVRITPSAGKWKGENVVRQRSMFSCGMSGDTLVWGMGEAGVVLHRRNVERSRRAPILILITGVTVNGTAADTLSGMKFPHDRNNITVSFAGLQFDPELRLNYRYRLVPSDTGWQEIGAQRFVTFAALSPGAYRLDVDAAAGGEQDRIMPASVSFTVAPPFWRTWWFVMLAALMIGGAVAAVVRFRLQRWKELESLRQRIAADLHDEIGSTLSGISLLSGVAESEVRTDPETAAGRLRGIGVSAREMMESMSDIVWTIDPANDPLEKFLLRFREYASELFEARQIRYEFDVTGGPLSLPMDLRRHLSLLLKEAVTNIVRHSGASFVRITIAASAAGLTVIIADNGCGMDATDVPTGNGIPNMRRRAEMMGARFSLSTARGSGTTIALKLGRKKPSVDDSGGHR